MARKERRMIAQSDFSKRPSVVHSLLYVFRSIRSTLSRLRGQAAPRPIRYTLSAARSGFTPTPESRLMRRGGALRRRDLVWGFTMVEIVVMLAILVMVSTILLANFQGFNEQAAIVRGAQELALELRRTQNLTLAVGRVQLENGKFYNGTVEGSASVANAKSPKAAGIHFDITTPSSKKQYVEFIDVPDGTGFNNNLYDGPSVDATVKTNKFERGIYISRLYVDGTCGAADFTTADIIFQSPDAALALNGDGASIIASCSFLKVELKSPSLNLTETVTARITGQISVQ